jgi:PadR family transcriptional regulator PadR
MGSDAELRLLQGTLDLLVLGSLTDGARHGYAIASWIRETSGDALQIEDGALYTALHRMEKRGWLESRWGMSERKRRAKYYQLTRSGRRALASRSRTWARYAEAVGAILDAAGVTA